MAKQLGVLADRLDDAASKAKVADDLAAIRNDINKIKVNISLLISAVGEAKMKIDTIQMQVNRLETQRNTTVSPYFKTPPTLTC